MTTTQLSAAMRVLADAADGAPPLETAKALMSLGVSFAPVDTLKGFLDDATRAQDDAIADAAEAAKVG